MVIDRLTASRAPAGAPTSLRTKDRWLRSRSRPSPPANISRPFRNGCVMPVIIGRTKSEEPQPDETITERSQLDELSPGVAGFDHNRMDHHRTKLDWTGHNWTNHNRTNPTWTNYNWIKRFDRLCPHL